MDTGVVSMIDGTIVVAVAGIVGSVVAGLRQNDVLRGGNLFLSSLALGMVLGVLYRWAVTPVPVPVGLLSGLVGALMASGVWSGAKSLAAAPEQRSENDRATTTKP